MVNIKCLFDHSWRWDKVKCLDFSEAHAKGLSIGLKNDAEQIHALHSKFDWALNEECHENNGGKECDLYKPFLDEGKVGHGNYVTIYELRYEISNNVAF